MGGGLSWGKILVYWETLGEVEDEKRLSRDVPWEDALHESWRWSPMKETNRHGSLR